MAAKSGAVDFVTPRVKVLSAPRGKERAGEKDEQAEGWIRALRPFVRVVVAVYAVAILWFIWMTKQLTFASFLRDPIFAGYSAAVVVYILSRFVFAQFYRPFP